MIKFLIGGSPCTHWSIAQSKDRETRPEGIGWELFKNYLIAKEKFRPDFFFAHNIPGVKQPEDRQIMLADILESVTGQPPIPLNTAKNGKAQCLRATCYKDGMRNLICNNVDRRTCVAEWVPFNYKPHKDSDIVITENSMRCQQRDKKHSTIQETHVTLPQGKTQTVSVAHIPMTFEKVIRDGERPNRVAVRRPVPEIPAV